MNWDTIKGKWSEVEGKIRAKWNKLTDDDIGMVRGKFTELAGRIQQRYGIARDEAEKHADEFMKDINNPPEPQHPSH